MVEIICPFCKTGLESATAFVRHIEGNHGIGAETDLRNMKVEEKEAATATVVPSNVVGKEEEAITETASEEKATKSSKKKNNEESET